MTLDSAMALPAVRSIPAQGEMGRTKAVMLLHGAWIALLAAAGLLYPVVQVDAERMVYPACVLFAVTFGWILWSWFALRGTLFEPYSLFIVTAGLFNGGQALLEVFGLNGNGILKGRVAAEILVRALFLVTLSLGCLHGGALIALGRSRKLESAIDTSAYRQRATRFVGWMLLGISVVPTLTLLRSSFALVLDYGYLGLYRQLGNVSLSFALSALLIPGTIFLLAGSKGKPASQALCLTILTLNAAINLFFGARGAAAMSFVATAWVFERSIRRIPRTLILALTLAAFVVFPLVRETRNMSGRYRLSLESQIQTLSNLENPISSSIAEMGYSLVTVTHTLALVPDIRPFDSGVSYLYALLAVVPNLGWEVHPSVAHGLLCDWLIAIVDPVIATSGGGLGFSFIAEAYLNFGWFGGLVCLGCLGFVFTWLFLKADANDPAKHALVATFLSFFFVFARGESAIVARGLVWYAVVPYLFVAALTLRDPQRTQRI